MTSILTTGAPGNQALEAIDRIRPVVEHHRDEAERERRLPDAVVAAMKSEGLFELCLPKQYGGAELDFPSYLEAVEAMATIDSAAGWMLAIAATAGVQAALLPEEGAREIYGSGALTAGSAIPRGQAVPVEGGYRLTGRWPLMSGCDHADWMGGLALIIEDGAPRMSELGMPDFTIMVFPRHDATIHDTWYATGMRGTGSSDVEVRDIFVPQTRCFSLFTAQSRIDSPLYRLRIEQHFFTVLSIVPLGIARTAIDEFVALAKEKTPTLSQDGLASRPTVHAEVARAEATLQSARAFVFEVAREMMDAVTHGPAVPEELEARRRLACVNAAESCERVVDAMYRLGGTTSIYQGHRLERCLRDIHAVNQHLAVSPVWWEKTGQFYFGHGLGMP